MKHSPEDSNVKAIVVVFSTQAKNITDPQPSE